MDFFEHQDAARRKTGRLVLLFVLAVLGVIGAVYVVAMLVFGFVSESVALWNPQALLAIGGAVTGVVAMGSGYKLAQLRGGGPVIAEMLGGELIDPNTTDLNERKVLNVVEEMSIASGVPVPPVYLMEDEHGINAFAAGYKPEDAVVGVTRGTIDLLTRDELQGVVAHEFSHIFNGDMRLNLRLIGVLHGILVIALIGYGILRSLRYSGGSRSSKDKGGGIIAILLFGVGLLIIGYIGVFFGNLIKAAVSRQREYLADASAVQFTRNPGGISGALKKIGGYTYGSKIVSPNADEASHLFFAQGVTHALNFMLATHPPLDRRISRIDPHWDGMYTQFGPEEAAKRRRRRQRKKKQHGGGLDRVLPIPPLADRIAKAREMAAMSGVEVGVLQHLVDDVGQPTPAHVHHAEAILAEIPEPLRNAAHDPYEARAVVFVLLLDEDGALREKQLTGIPQTQSDPLRDLTRELHGSKVSLSPAGRLPLLDLCLPALRRLSPRQYQTFMQQLATLIEADRHVSLFEWMLFTLMRQHLRPTFEKVRPTPVKHKTLHPVTDECSIVLSALARIGTNDAAVVQQAFDHATVSVDEVFALRSEDETRFDRVTESLETLDGLAPKAKEQFLRMCCVVISADKRITVNEVELLRAIADALGCPMPPMLPGS